MSIIFNSPDIIKNIKGFVQIGACIGEEYSEWKKTGIKNQIFIEPVPNIFEILQNNITPQISPGECVNLFPYAISNQTSIGKFNIAPGFCSSSLLDFEDDAIQKTTNTSMSVEKQINIQIYTLDDLFKDYNLKMENYNLLFMDAQGNEGPIIDGACEYLKYVNYIFTEVTHTSLYKNQLLYEDIVKKLNEKGFILLHLEKMNEFQSDALFYKK